MRTYDGPHICCVRCDAVILPAIPGGVFSGRDIARAAEEHYAKAGHLPAPRPGQQLVAAG